MTQHRGYNHRGQAKRVVVARGTVSSRAVLTVLCIAFMLSGVGCARGRSKGIVVPPLEVRRQEREPLVEEVPDVWPVMCPARRVTSSFAEIRHGGRSHKGIDIAAPQGTPVLATDSGTTLYSGWQRGYGKIVIVCHGHGRETAYAHLERSLVSPGDPVRRGQEIGRVGATGNATGPHLHYEVRHHGVAVNPTSMGPGQLYAGSP